MRGSRARRAAVAWAILAGAIAAWRPVFATDALTVCADPGNLPYSDEHEDGFANRVARLIADDMHATLRYVWMPERLGFLRRGLLGGACDLVVAVPADLPGIAATRAYFSSGYMFVSERGRNLHLGSFDDPLLRTLRIGLPLVGSGGINTPAALSLSRRGLASHVTGFPVWQFDSAHPQSAIIEAVAGGDIDVAVVWGPFAGYFAKPYGDRLVLDFVKPDPLLPSLTFTYAMSAAVRPGDDQLRSQVDTILDRRANEIRAILTDYGVPLMPAQ